jgi:hypothetical protein
METMSGREARDGEHCRRIMEVIEHAVRNGERCPTNEQIEYIIEPEVCWGAGRYLVMLRQQGKIRVEVYAKNYRVIRILQGELKGRETKAPKPGLKPHRVLHG